MSQVTSHILDTTRGKPAQDVPVILYRQAIQWEEIAESVTNKDGRVADLLDQEVWLPPGTYKLKFLTKKYFDRISVATFYPCVEIIFEITGQKEHYHVPLLLNPFGYTTYRGS